MPYRGRMAQATLDQRGNRWRVRWRIGGGSGTQTTTSFDKQHLAERAVAIINGVHGNISKVALIAAVFDLSAEAVAEATSTVVGPHTKKNVPLVRELIPAFLDARAMTTQESTRERYAKHLEVAFLPTIGDLPVDQVTDKHIRDVMVRMTKCECTETKFGKWCGRRRDIGNNSKPTDPHPAGIEKRTQDRYYSAVRALFNFARRERLISVSPVPETGYKQQTLPKYNSGAKEDVHFYLTEAQYKLLRSKFPAMYHTFLDFLLETGVRYSEATALTVSAIHGDPDPHIYIHVTWKHSEKRGDYLGPPKSGATRKVPISPQLLKKLLAHCEGMKPGEFVFKSPRGNWLERSNFCRNTWDPAMTAARRCATHPPAPQERHCSLDELTGPRCGDNGGLSAAGKPCRQPVLHGTNRCYSHTGPARDAVSECSCTDPQEPGRLPKAATPHDLRHTHVAWLIKKGAPLKAISVRIGHANTAITEAVYAGLLDEVSRAAALLAAITF